MRSSVQRLMLDLFIPLELDLVSVPLICSLLQASVVSCGRIPLDRRRLFLIAPYPHFWNPPPRPPSACPRAATCGAACDWAGLCGCLVPTKRACGRRRAWWTLATPRSWPWTSRARSRCGCPAPGGPWPCTKQTVAGRSVLRRHVEQTRAVAVSASIRP